VVDHYHNMTRLQLEKLLIEKDEHNMQLQEKLEEIVNSYKKILEAVQK